MLPFKTLIRIDTRSGMPMYLQIANAVIREISQGRIASGTRMPSSRKMASLLEVNRRTVVSAYDELTAQGWLTSHSTSGTFVNQDLPTVVPTPLKSSFPKPSRLDIVPKPKIEPLCRFDDGHPDVRLAPLQALAREYSSLLKNTRFLTNLDYTDQFAGDPILRRQLAIHLRDTRGIYVDIDQILVTRGSIMAFYLILETLLKSGDQVVVGKPGYGTFNSIVKQKGGALMQVEVDEQGMLVDQVEEICKKGKVDFVYVVPHHHHPTTVTLSPERRIKLLELAQTYGFYIIEDDYDYDFHYQSSPILPLASLQHNGQVMYVGSFSKSIAPSLRLGFLIADAAIVEKLAGIRRYIDRNGDPLLERAVSHLLKHGEIRRHLQKSLRAYKSRRDHLCFLLENKLRDHLSFKAPEGGMAAWVTFKGNRTLEPLWEDFIKNGLHINHPSEYSNEAHSRGTRLGFASISEQEISDGVELMLKSL